MPGPSPTIEGFRATATRPAVIAAEILWRWSFGAAACTLIAITLLEFLDSLTVTRNDLLLLSTRQPLLIGRVLAHIFGGSAPRLLAASLILLPAVALLWMAAASFGRNATVEELLEYFGHKNPAKSCWTSLAGLNFLRVVLTFTALVGCAGAIGKQTAVVTTKRFDHERRVQILL